MVKQRFLIFCVVLFFINPVWAIDNPLGKLSKAIQSVTSSDELLLPDQAFQFRAEVKDSNTVRVSWQIAEGYYLYRDRIKFSLPENPGVAFGAYQIPHGKQKIEEQGPMEVFFHELSFDLPINRQTKGPLSFQLQAKYQGCAERGVCYPPMQKIIKLDLPDGAVRIEKVAEQDRIADSLKNDSIWLIALSFLGFGVLMAFSPCIFPMIPILSGIIIGHGHKITTGKAFFLSLSYVLAASLTYTLMGVLAGLFGGNLQAAFQNTWVIASFSGLFVLLALSMFGFYDLQIPPSIQERVARLSHHQQGGTFWGAAIMGALSALIVGPCMAAPLAGALIYIGQTGDAVLGGVALFSLGLGMGIPLLVIGTSAGKLLPKAGLWMNAVKSAFGVGMLGVAVWLLERIIPGFMTMLLWSFLLIISGVYLGALDSLGRPASGWSKLWKGVGVVLLVYGVILLIGAAGGSVDPFKPLRVEAAEKVSTLAFTRVKSLDELQKNLLKAREEKRVVLLDYYADWCVSCKEMDRDTFSDPSVKASLAKAMLLRADVTENSSEDKALLEHFNLIGPPATLFFGADGIEQKNHRIIGYMNAADFLGHLKEVFNL